MVQKKENSLRKKQTHVSGTELPQEIHLDFGLQLEKLHKEAKPLEQAVLKRAWYKIRKGHSEIKCIIAQLKTVMWIVTEYKEQISEENQPNK